jgi:hypothetical protein
MDEGELKNVCLSACLSMPNLSPISLLTFGLILPYKIQIHN